MILRIVPIFTIVCVAACSNHTASIDRSTAHYLDRVSMNVADVSTRFSISVDRGSTVAAARSDGGAAVFTPSLADHGGFVGWLDLPKAHACAARLPAAYYVLDARVTATEAFLTLREVDGAARLEDLRFAVERIDDDTPVAAMARIAFGPERFLLGRWFRCSDGVGHCGWALTLDAATPGCG